MEKFGRIINNFILIIVLTVLATANADSTRHENNDYWSQNAAAPVHYGQSPWRPKQGFDNGLNDIDEPTVVTTGQVVNTTWRVMGVIATLFAFIIIPAIDAVLNSASSGLDGDFVGRRMGHLYGARSFNSRHRQARGILDYDACIELLSCSVSSFTGTGRSERVTAWTEWYLGDAKPGSITSRILKARQSTSCEQYQCNPLSFVVRLFIYLTDWNTILKV